MDDIPKMCKYCSNWHSPFDDGFGDTFGQCDNPLVETSVLKEKEETIYDEQEHVIFTGQHFGCIYFEKANGLARNVVLRKIK